MLRRSAGTARRAPARPRVPPREHGPAARALGAPHESPAVEPGAIAASADAEASSERPRDKRFRISLVNANSGATLLRLVRGGWFQGHGVIAAQEVSTLPEQMSEVAAQLGKLGWVVAAAPSVRTHKGGVPAGTAIIARASLHGGR